MAALVSNANSTSTDPNPIMNEATVSTLSSVPVVHVLCCPACRFTALALAPLAAHWNEAHPGMSACSLRLYGCTACSSTATERHLMGQHCQLFHTQDQQAGVILLREETLPSVPMWQSKEKESSTKDVESSTVSSPLNANVMEVDDDDKIDAATLSTTFLSECQSSAASNAACSGSATGSKRRKQNTPGRCKLSPPSPQPQHAYSLASLHQKQVQLLQRSQGMKNGGGGAVSAQVTAVVNSLNQQLCQENAQDLSLNAVKRELKQHVKMNESKERSRNSRNAHKKDDNEEALDMRINKVPSRQALAGPAVVTSSPLPIFNGHSQFPQQILQQNPLTSTAMAAAIAAAAAVQSSTTASASMTLADLALRCQTMRPLFRPIHESPLVDVLTHLGNADSPPLNSHSGCSSHGSESSQQDGLCGGGGGGSDSTGGGSRSRPQRQNFSPTQNKVLMEWYMEHRDKPYPSTEETKELARRSGLQYSQVKKWFANKRARTQLCQRRLTKSESGSRAHIYERNQSSSGELSPGQVFQNGAIPSGYDTSPTSPASGGIPPFISVKSENTFYYSNAEGSESTIAAAARVSQLPLMTLAHSATSSGAASPITP